MSKGTPAHGKRNRSKTHVRCPRCGSMSLHHRRKVCSSCGYGRSSKRND
ncbi:MAG: 50S ribosomal protein L37e [Candidatus Altiarchaeota archaeon]|nr:50S ribosomal protein L37e [Candidatus Altiarchaeota archaeon]